MRNAGRAVVDVLLAEGVRFVFGLPGYVEAFYDELPSGSRVAYMDATRDLPGMIELIEHTDAQERVYTEIYEAAIGWDGHDPVRRSPG